ncbi:MAG TPA: hypothetical protein VKX46_11545 [Ktedonobacteraceae bacterium]|nr:hypothetical protein [Ktedonobacteraceae bacterium]
MGLHDGRGPRWSREYLKGSLTLDELGDAVVLLILPKEQIANNGAQATVVGGKVV